MADPGPSSTSQGSPLDVDVVHHAEIWDRLPVSDAILTRAARAALTAASPARHAPYQVTLVLADDFEMRTLNRTWRGKDASTNVLSFPAGEPAGEMPGEPVSLGDVVLAGETVLAEADDKGIPAADHVVHLVVHGVLHLLGFDHEHDEGAETMEALETKVLAGLGIADPYGEDVAAHPAEASP
jgi:probable rRNA maturation factor